MTSEDRERLQRLMQVVMALRRPNSEEHKQVRHAGGEGRERERRHWRERTGLAGNISVQRLAAALSRLFHLLSSSFSYCTQRQPPSPQPLPGRCQALLTEMERQERVVRARESETLRPTSMGPASPQQQDFIRASKKGEPAAWLTSRQGQKRGWGWGGRAYKTWECVTVLSSGRRFTRNDIEPAVGAAGVLLVVSSIVCTQLTV